MTRKMVPNVKGLLFACLIVAIFTVGLAPTLEATTLTLYDSLSKEPISAAKWDKYESARVIDRDVHMLKLGVRSASGTTGPITNSLPVADPSTVSKIKATITPISFLIGSDVSPTAKAMAMVGGRFYNDGTSSGSGDCTGDVLGQVGIGNTSVSGTSPVVYWAAVRYTSSDCSDTEVLKSGTFTTTVMMGTPYTVDVEWDGAKLTFGYNGTTKTYTPLTDINEPVTSFKGLVAKVKDNAGLDAYVFAHFDDVYTNDNPHDDFLADQIDQAKWNNPESVRKIDAKSKSLILLARGSINSTGATENNLPIALPETVKTIQATVKAVELHIDPPNGSANAFAYVGGRFFNDGSGSAPGAKIYEGDIGALIKLQVTNNGAQYVGKCKVVRFTGDTIDENVTIDEYESPKLISLNKPYTLSVGWDGSKFTFVGNKETYIYTVPVTMTASATDAKMPYKGLGTVISEAEVTGTAIAYFTNVMVDAPQSLTMDIVGTGSVKSSPTGILCDNTNAPCSGAFPYGKKVTLNAKAGTGWVFEKWVYVSGMGTCTTKTSCAVTVDDAKEMQANFIKEPTIAVSPAGKKNFPNVKAGSTKPATASFTITNKTTKGVADLTISNISLDITLGDPNDFLLQGSDSCLTAPIASKGKCTFKVLFQPLNTGAKAATLTIDSDDPSSPSTVVNLTGNGTTP